MSLIRTEEKGISACKNLYRNVSSTHSSVCPVRNKDCDFNPAFQSY